MSNTIRSENMTNLITTSAALAVAAFWALLWWQGFLGAVLMILVLHISLLTPTPVDDGIIAFWRKWIGWAADRVAKE